MIAFEIYLNREKLCVASVGNDGVLSAIVDCVSRSAEDRLELAVGGLISAKQDHLKWINQDLHMGDEITIKIVATGKSQAIRDERREKTGLGNSHPGVKYYSVQFAGNHYTADCS
jgi:hypothetical protein